jgi:uncharacterized protein (DUF952 family)
MLVYKILRDAEWREFEVAGETAGTPVDLADGFIHLSAADQVAGTAAKHFAGEDGLVLLECDADALGPELRWEPSRGGALFPHLYRNLTRADVIEILPLPCGRGGHLLPERLRR